MLARTLLVGVTTFLFATPALAAVDLAVSIVTLDPVYVYDYATYDVEVSNLSNEKASDVDVIIELPATNTPQVEVFGFVMDIDHRCTLVGTEIHCNLGILPQGTMHLTFLLGVPWSNQPLDVTATVTSSSPEVTLANNTDAVAGPLWYYTVDVQPGQYPVEGCMSAWPFGYSSFFECTIDPASPMNGLLEFDSGGHVWVPGVSGIIGTWWQPTSERLVYTYDRGGIMGVEQFEGWGVSPSCFEGFSSYAFSGVAHPRRICF
jgi:Domain of unknown function DUF11